MKGEKYRIGMQEVMNCGDINRNCRIVFEAKSLILMTFGINIYYLSYLQLFIKQLNDIIMT